jgi:hypothetical protein
MFAGVAALTSRYRMLFVAGLATLACFVAVLGASSRAGAASASVRDDNHLTCGGLFRQGSGVTHIVVKAEKKKDEDTWASRPTWLASDKYPGWVGEPGFSWETKAALFRGCSNAITFAVVNAHREQALIGIAIAQSFGSGAAGRTATCDVLTKSHHAAQFTCHRTRQDTLNGQFDVWFRITSP